MFFLYRYGGLSGILDELFQRFWMYSFCSWWVCSCLLFLVWNSLVEGKYAMLWQNINKQYVWIIYPDDDLCFLICNGRILCHRAYSFVRFLIIKSFWRIYKNGPNGSLQQVCLSLIWRQLYSKFQEADSRLVQIRFILPSQSNSNNNRTKTILKI
jgi:hypothetical protein